MLTPRMNPKLYHPPSFRTSKTFTSGVKSEMTNVTGLMIPCHNPCQKPAAFAAFSSSFGPGAQPLNSSTVRATPPITRLRGHTRLVPSFEVRIQRVSSGRARPKRAERPTGTLLMAGPKPLHPGGATEQGEVEAYRYGRFRSSPRHPVDSIEWGDRCLLNPRSREL